MFGGSPKPEAPAPLPPPPNPASYASSTFVAPTAKSSSIFEGLDSSIATSPLGVADSRSTQRKSLFGQ